MMRQGDPGNGSGVNNNAEYIYYLLIPHVLIPRARSPHLVAFPFSHAASGFHAGQRDAAAGLHMAVTRLQQVESFLLVQLAPSKEYKKQSALPGGKLPSLSPSRALFDL
jgi:hypothetical protein